MVILSNERFKSSATVEKRGRKRKRKRERKRKRPQFPPWDLAISLPSTKVVGVPGRSPLSKLGFWRIFPPPWTVENETQNAKVLKLKQLNYFFLLKWKIPFVSSWNTTDHNKVRFDLKVTLLNIKWICNKSFKLLITNKLQQLFALYVLK